MSSPMPDVVATLAEVKATGKPTQAQILVNEAERSADLFHDDGEVAYATISVDGHRETWPVRSTPYRRTLVRMFRERFDKPPSASALTDAVTAIDSAAVLDGPERPIFQRVGEHDGNVYLDLCDDRWRAVEVTPGGWQVVDDPPVRFTRSPGMLALPQPQSDGSVEDLEPLCNVGDRQAFMLAVSWLLAALRPTGPYPVLILVGEQGTAKSSLVRLLRDLVDPSSAQLRRLPRDERELFIAARRSWILPFDNVSRIYDWQSDALCTVSTGGGYTTRKLYTDDDEVMFDVARPVVINGIEEAATRGDLMDRAIVIHPPPIDDAARLTERELRRRYEALRPRVLGALLDATSTGLRNLPNTRLGSMPRMADFYTWVSACEPALPWGAGALLDAYEWNREEAVEIELEADDVAKALRSLLSDHLDWTGTCTDLLDELSRRVSERVAKSRAWPKAANTLSGRLNRSSAALRKVGIAITKIHGDAGERLVRVERPPDDQKAT